MTEKDFCLCGSGRTTAECCIPKQYPIVDGALGLKDVNVRLEGVGIFGQRVPVPSELTATLTLNQPHHVDPSVHTALHHWNEAIFLKVKLLAPQVALARLRTPSNLLSNLDDSLHATRYHQRQFLCRLRTVNRRHALGTARGSEQLQIIFNDLPLRCELEAFLLRVSGSLDALGQILGLLVTGKGRTYGELLRTVRNKREINPTLRTELTDIFSEHLAWIEEARTYRHAIVHRAEFTEFRGPIMRNQGMGTPVVGERDASDFAMHVWGQLVRMIESTGEVMYRRSTDWQIP